MSKECATADVRHETQSHRTLLTGNPDVETAIRTITEQAGPNIGDTTVICLLANTTPSQWRLGWETTAAWRPATVDIAQLVPDPEQTEGEGIERAHDIVTRKRCIQLSQLSQIGRFLTDRLAARTERGEVGSVVVYIDCVDALLAHHDRAQVFKFLLIVGQKLEFEGVSLVARLDTTAVDAETTLVLSEAFDDRTRPIQGAMTGLLD